MIGRTNTGGGGGGLNFKVIPNPQPSTEKENTIWVNTDKINNYYFSATQPENMVNYDVWFQTGGSSVVEFNALKKNGIQVYPISAKQYVDGAWKEATAQTYQNGIWRSWITWLVKDGVIDTSITNFDTYGVDDKPDGYSNWAATVTKSNNRIKIEHTSGDRICSYRSVGSVDLTSYSTLYMNVLSISESASARLNVSNDTNYIGTANKSISVGVNELDVSSITGKNYINIPVWAWGGGGYIEFDDLWLG